MPVHKFPFSIAYADTDAGGSADHGRYIESAERARMNWLRGARPAAGDIGFVVREIRARYMHPLKLGDNFIVESQIVKRGAASLDIEQKFVKDDTVCAIIDLTVAYIGGDMRPKRIPNGVLGAAE